MRAALVHLTILVLTLLLLAGCSAATDLTEKARRDSRLLSPSPSATTVTAAKPSTPTITPVVTSSTVSATVTPSSNAAQRAIQAVIQRANDEQQQAFAKQDPSLMKDTATSGYYAQLVQTNRDLASSGISAIKLVKLEWGPIAVHGTTAQATTFETWRTFFSNSETDQSRDRNVYTLVQQQGTWKIQSDVQPDSGLDQPSGNPSPTAPGQPQVPPRTLPNGTGESNNWSGYAATSGTFTGVTGTWTVPQTTSTGSFASGATWVGIGGVRHRDLIQAGTQEVSNGGGQTRYEAWIEMLPQPSRRVSLSVSPGDSVTVSMTKQGADQWRISFKDNTTGQSYQTTVTYASSLSSAEWIEEAPSARRRLLPLDNFGTVQFSGASAIENGKQVTIAQAGGRPITMIDFNGSAIATPSALTSNGSGFSISRTTPSPAAIPGPERGSFPERRRGFSSGFLNNIPRPRALPPSFSDG